MPNRDTAERWLRAAGPGFTEAEIRAELDRLAQGLDRMERSLSEHAWLGGKGYSLADVDMAPFVHRLVKLGHDGMIAARPRVADWYARLSSRPAFAVAMSFRNPDA